MKPPGAAAGLSAVQRIDWLRLIRTENIGPASFRRLINRFGSAAAALDALPALTRNAGGKPAHVPTRDQIEDEIAALDKLGARFVASPDPDYPNLLRHIPGPPPVIAVKGSAERDFSRSVGIVGARNASTAGLRMTRLLAGELGAAGYVIVSGLARGIDAAAHVAALETGTLAVLAGGMDRIYPEQNVPLAEEIVARGGALVSEMPLGWEPRARDFPRRNRIVSGLSLGVVVIEAAKRSGSLITARLALEQNREVFAVPGSPLDARSEGANGLIRQGAMLVTSAADIVETLSEADPTRLPLFEDDDVFEAVDPQSAEPDADARQRLVSALSVTPVTVDQLIADTGIAPGVMQTLLMELDIAGRVEWSSGQLVSLIAAAP